MCDPCSDHTTCPPIIGNGNSSSGLLFWKQAAANTCAPLKSGGRIATEHCCITASPQESTADTPLTEKSLLETEQKRFLACVNQANITSSLAYQTKPENAIKYDTMLLGMREQYGRNRQLQYQRLPPPFIPPSVMELAMNTVNVGVPCAIVRDCNNSRPALLH